MTVGWILLYKDLHSDARHKFLLWHKNGRLRSGKTFEPMKSRTRFEWQVKFCKNEENILKKVIPLKNSFLKIPRVFERSKKNLRQHIYHEVYRWKLKTSQRYQKLSY